MRLTQYYVAAEWWHFVMSCPVSMQWETFEM